ncbi:SPOR domain-containing protein [Luteimonas sp. RD2P54]|uniref:SPOR domain-containing protein n=1 Tax=Luteimonas endophytica TaxID=3042023 RepID=A0ABT6J4P2_9GAMM|nr:SPOR domain-containing protein [Luteimonas endophytica]MDH5821785.1 SPOR domain-containing protein [Luteimonas endophytica]
MDSGLKQRLVGAAVLVALAVIFLPMLVKGPAPDSGASDLSLALPDEPRDGTITRELPLLAPAEPGAGGAVGMDTQGDEARLATVDTADERHPDAAELAADEAPAAGPAPAAESGDATPAAALPATTAGGGYAVRFGSYGSSTDADAVVERLRQTGLPAAPSRATVSGKPVWRVLIGPYATRAEAEAVRVHAAQVGPNDARVVALDAAPAPQPAAPPQPQPPSPPQRAPQAAAPAAPAPAAAADVGFVVQLGAFSRSAEAEALRERVRGAGFSAFTDTVDTDKGRLTRVKAGPVLSRAEAERLKATLQGRLGVAGMVRSHP